VNVSRRHIKQVCILIVFIFINFLIISVLSKIYYEFNSGADRSTSLHIELKNNDYYLPNLSFNTNNSKGRKLNPEVLKNIKKDYLNAWYVKSYALKHNDINSFKDFYTDSAQVKLTEMIQYNYKNKISVESTSLQHNIDVQFFSEDGQLVFLKDIKVEEVINVSQNGVFIHSEQSFNDYDVVLLLEDGFWRIRHIIKTNHFDKNNTTSIIERNDVIDFSIKGINYYPQKTPWLDFWNKYDESVIDKDFELIKSLGLNTVRIFIPYNNFGGTEVSLEKINHLKTTLDLAEKKSLKVIITFFDFYSNYNIIDYSLCDRHLEQIIPKIKKHKAILQYDIKNEPDLDFAHTKEKKVLDWLKFISERIKLYDDNTPITIGWSDIKYAQLLENNVDVLSFHYYKKASKFSKEYTNLRMKTKKQLVLQEFGKHSYNSFWFPFSNTEIDQAIYYKKMQEQFHQSSLNNFVSWTLYDFPSINTSIFGSLPQKINPQKNYGFIDINGNKKEATKFIIHANNELEISIFDYFNHFYISLLLVIITLFFFYKYIVRKKRSTRR